MAKPWLLTGAAVNCLQRQKSQQAPQISCDPFEQPKCVQTQVKSIPLFSEFVETRGITAIHRHIKRESGHRRWNNLRGKKKLHNRAIPTEIRICCTSLHETSVISDSKH